MQRILLIVLLFVLSIGIWAEEQDETIISPELQAHLAELEAYVLEMRGLAPITPVNYRFWTREEVIETNQQLYEEEVSKDYPLDTFLFYRAFEFIPDDPYVLRPYVQAIGMSVLGFYDHYNQVLNIVRVSDAPLGDTLHPREQIVYVHEFVHALQDQHFDLAMLASVQQRDLRLAIRATVEGDALQVHNWFEVQLLQNDPSLRELLGEVIVNPEIYALTAETPTVFLEEAMFIYRNGHEFVRYLYRTGGWDLVNQALVDVPQGSVYILHPERYVAGNNPQQVTLPDALPTLGAGWEFVTDSVVGVFYLREYLRRQLPYALTASALSKWDGDLIHIYYLPEENHIAWTLGMAWQTAQATTDFANLYTMFLEYEFPNWNATEGCGSSAQKAMCFVQIEDRVYTTSAPDKPTAMALLEQITLVTE